MSHSVAYRLILTVLVALGGAYSVPAQTPHLDAERQKNMGVGYLEEDQPVEAAKAFRLVISLAPTEALGYADLGLCYLRMGQADSAGIWLAEARRREPGNVAVLLLAAEAQQWKGDWAPAMATAREAQGLQPRNKQIGYYVYRAAAAQRGDPDAQETAFQEIARLYEMVPQNPVVAVKYARHCAQRGELAQAGRAFEALRPAVEDMGLPAGALAQVDQAMSAGDARRAQQGLTILENVLRPTPRFKQALGELQAPVTGLPLTRFSPLFYEGLKPERPPAVRVRFVPMDADALPEEGAKVGRGGGDPRGSLDVADVDGDGLDDLLASFARGKRGYIQVWRRAQGKWTPALAGQGSGPADAARFVDFDNDGCFDIAAVGRGGLRLLRGDSTQVWRDVTASAGLIPEPGVCLDVVDADNEGDLDLCVGSADGMRLWQNRLDGTFREAGERSGLAGAGPGAVLAYATDQDGDLDTDVFILDAGGRARLFDNLRQGRFAEADGGVDTTACRSLLASDFDNDGFVDLLLVGRDGTVRLQHNAAGAGFTPAVAVPTGGLWVETATALDFDNDGWQDVAVAGASGKRPALAVLRNGGDGRWEALAVDRPPEGCAALAGADLDRDGDLDLLAVDGQGRLRGWRNDGGNANHWLRVKLQGLRTSGTKNNLHGIGSWMEVKAGLSYQMQVVRGPVTHFGLGTQEQADLLRVVWSNGVPQNRLRPAADQTVLEPQILKGSCPYLYCWDGETFTFVTDLLAAAPLGLQPAEGVIAPDNPRELMTIPKRKIGTQYGEFVFQFTSELWETVYLDEAALWVVDHPAGTEVFTDQRYLPPPYAPPGPILTQGRVAPVRAENSQGEEVTERLLAFDHRYPETLRPSRYQGVVAPHTLTLCFGDVQGLAHPLLVMGCWIFWTDTSINVSMSQGTAVVPGPTVLEVWHPESGWRALEGPFGLPNGKDKWVVVDLSGQLTAGDARVRLRTTSQIYWDQAFLADAVSLTPHRITRLMPRYADLHYGGFNRLYRPAEDGPHLYDYGQKVYLPVWMDMAGMATRYGDVTELLTASDDCFVIFTGGDEVSIRFDASALPAVQPGWERDYLFYSDGWEKDSDRNTVTGDTVGPLPFHAMSAYPYPPSESYPDDEAHRVYIERYNTRRIGPEAFRRFVRDYTGGGVPPLPWALEAGVRGAHDAD